jgi:hypothetical protein
MELTGALGHFTTWAMGWLVNLATVAAIVGFGVVVLRVIMAGGKGRAVWELVFGLGVVVILFAALRDWQGTWVWASGLGDGAWQAIKAELAAGLG